MRQIRHRVIIGLITSVSLLLTACSDGFGDLEKYIASTKARPKGVIEPLPERKIVEPFVFEPEGLRNPFQPIQNETQLEEFSAVTDGGLKPDLTRRKEVLEEYPLDALTMVGTMRMGDGSELWGLIKVSDGSIHRTTVGNYMGENFGKIIQVRDDGIEVMEMVSKQPGVWEEHQVSLTLVE